MTYHIAITFLDFVIKRRKNGMIQLAITSNVEILIKEY